MKKNWEKTLVIIFCVCLFACKAGKETPASVAEKWCTLNGKVYKSAYGKEKDAARTLLHQFEMEMEARYKEDSVFMNEIEKEVEKCEGVSEGRQVHP